MRAVSEPRPQCSRAGCNCAVQPPTWQFFVLHVRRCLHWHAKVQLVLWSAPRCVYAFAWGFWVQAAHSRSFPPLSPPGSGQQAGGSRPACTLPPCGKAAGASPHGHGYETVLSPHQVRMRVRVAPLCAGGALMCCAPLVALGSVREAGRQRAGGDIETALCRHHALYGILVRVFDPTPGQWDGYTLRACCRRRALHRTLRAAPALACVLQCTRRSVVSRGCPVRSRCRRCGLGRSLATRQ